MEAVLMDSDFDRLMVILDFSDGQTLANVAERCREAKESGQPVLTREVWERNGATYPPPPILDEHGNTVSVCAGPGGVAPQQPPLHPSGHIRARAR